MHTKGMSGMSGIAYYGTILHISTCPHSWVLPSILALKTFRCTRGRVLRRTPSLGRPDGAKVSTHSLGATSSADMSTSVFRTRGSWSGIRIGVGVGGGGGVDVEAGWFTCASGVCGFDGCSMCGGVGSEMSSVES